MADDLDPGIDKQRLLDEIVGASAAEAAQSPVPPASPPVPVLASAAPPANPPPKPPPVPAPARAQVPASKPATPAPAATVAAPAPIVPRPQPKPLGPLRFRHEAAALVLGFCGVIWGAVGIGTRAWVPGGFGALLLLAGLGAWTWSLWREED